VTASASAKPEFVLNYPSGYFYFNSTSAFHPRQEFIILDDELSQSLNDFFKKMVFFCCWAKILFAPKKIFYRCIHINFLARCNRPVRKTDVVDVVLWRSRGYFAPAC